MLYDKEGSALVHTLWKQPSLKVTKTNLQISPGVRIYWQSDMNTNSDVTPLYGQILKYRIWHICSNNKN